MKKILVKKILFLSFVFCFLCGCGFTANQKISDTDETVIKELEAKKNRPPREKITIQKFFDFQCEYCRQSVSTMRALQATYGKRLEVNYYHFPTKPGSALLAEAAECARDQAKFDEFFENYFTHFFGKHDLTDIRTLSEKISLDQTQLTTCLESGVKKSIIAEHLLRGRKYGVTAVPFFVVGDQQITGSYPKSAFEKIIQYELTQ